MGFTYGGYIARFKSKRTSLCENRSGTGLSGKRIFTGVPGKKENH
jgi:hypothetical protein